MISQGDLSKVRGLELEIAVAAETDPVKAYLRMQTELKLAMSRLRERCKKNEAIEPGELVLTVERTPVVDWPKILAHIQTMPPVQKALNACREAARILKQAAGRDTKSDFVTERLSVSIGFAPEPPAAAAA